MKRVFTILLVVTLMVGVLSTGMVSYANAAMKMVGDVNGDGRVNNRDLGGLQMWLNGYAVNVDTGSDINGDDKVNALGI